MLLQEEIRQDLRLPRKGVNPNHLAERIQARDLRQGIKGKAVASRDVQKADMQM